MSVAEGPNRPRAFTRPHYGTIVVGAGPAGIMAAIHAAERAPVLLLERCTLPRRKSCGGMLHPLSLLALQPYASIPEDVVVPPRTVTFRYHDWDRGVSKSTHVKFLNVSRADFDHWLLGLLPASVEVVSHATLVALRQDDASVTASVRIDGVEHVVTADLLVGADGARSAVRRCLAIRQSASYVTVQDVVRTRASMDAVFDCIYMDSLRSRVAYSYVIPKGDTALVGSVFYPHTSRPWETQDHIMARMRNRLPQLGDATYRDAAPALYVRSPEDIITGAGRVLLAGEAGGFISPSSGEGISWALRSGRDAGIAIASHPDGALDHYRALTLGMRLDLTRRLRWLPFMESRASKYLAGLLPAPIMSLVTQGL